MMWAAVSAGGLAAGLVVMVRGWRPAPRPLAELAEELRRERGAPGAADDLRSGWRRLAARLAGRPSLQQLADLALLERTREQHSVDKVGFALGFSAVGIAAAIAVTTAGLSLPWAAEVGVVLALGACGFVHPDVQLRSKARAERQAWCHALAVFLDVVGISLAGGAGVEDAVIDAATTGSGAQLERLASTLHRAQMRRRSPWLELEQLGREANITSLRELAASMELASESGSRVYARHSPPRPLHCGSSN